MSSHRQCTIEFKNESTFTLRSPRVFEKRGICEDPLPPSLHPSQSDSALFKKTPDTAAGVIGVLTYDLKNASGELMQEKMAVMFVNPYDFNLHSNWFAVGFFDRSRACDDSLCDEMYKGPETTFVRGKAGKSLTYEGLHVTVNATMSDSYTAVIKLEVEDSSFSAHRQCTLEFKNESKSTLLNPSVFIESGTCEDPLPPSLVPSESGSALFRNTPDTAAGTVGVLTYDLQKDSGELMEEKMAVMFFNPYDFNLHSNWFAVGFFDRSRACDDSLCDEMYKGPETTFVRGKAGKSLTYKGQHVTINATMSDSYTAVIKLEVEDSSFSAHRQCTLEFKNESKSTLLNPSVFIESGTCEDPLPPSLVPSESGSALFRNTPDTAAGTVGVLTYDLQKDSGELMEEIMAVMFFNPYDFNLYSNWFAVGLFDRSRACDDSLCDEMYKGPETTFVRGKAGQSLTYANLHVTVNATMSDSYTPVIKLEVEDSSFSTHRQCTLDFKNESKSTLLNPSVFTESGTCEDPLPPSLSPSQSGSALFKKTPYTICGSVGVLTYDLKNASGELMQEKMAVMFSNPYNFNLYSNWFAVGFFDQSRDCDYSLYDEMYKGSETTFVRGKAGKSLTYEGLHVTVNASMSDTYTPVIKLEVEDKPVPSHRQCTIHFKNESKSTLLSPSEFMQRGNVVKTPPKTISPSASGSALFQNLPGDTWGAAGVMTYNVRDSSGKLKDKKVAVMFQNSSQCSGNIFAVGLFIRSRPCDESLYEEMLNEEPTTFVRGEAGQPLSYDGQGVTIKANMSAAHNSVIQVEFSDD